MSKLGQVDLIASSIALLVVFAFGSYYAYDGIRENRYVLDVSTKTIYDLRICSVKDIDQSNLVSVGDLNEAIGKGNQLAQCTG